jgi:hypothetical protein
MVQSGAYEVDLRESFLREGLQEVTTAELIEGCVLHLSGGADHCVHVPGLLPEPCQLLLVGDVASNVAGLPAEGNDVVAALLQALVDGPAEGSCCSDDQNSQSPTIERARREQGIAEP